MATTSDYIDVTESKPDHNPSSQQNVIKNDDPVLQKSHEHHHEHLHHDAHAEESRKDEVVYSYGTTFEGRTIPRQDPQDHDLHRRRDADMAKEPATAFDREQGALSPSRSEEDPQTPTFSNLYKRYRIFFHLFVWLFFTGWWIAGLLVHGIHDPLSSNTGWLKPFLLWLGVTLRVVFFHVPITILTKPMHWVWESTGVRFAELLPNRFKIPLGAVMVLAVFLIGGFASPESEDNTRDNRAVSLFGLAVFVFVLYATSRNRKAVNWHTVIVGMLVQFIVALFVLRSGAVIFFVALVQLCFYNGIFQWFIGKFAVFFFWSMCSGFATIAGSVLIAYISLGVNAQALVSSCVMSIPASLAVSKLRYPETEETLTTGRVVIPDDDEHKAANSLHAFANGAWLGLKIAGMILTTLLCIIALLGLFNGLLTWWGRYLKINDPPLTVELIVGYICYPIAFLLGVRRNGDLLKVAQLIGTKLVANEFVAYTALQTDPAYAELSARSRLIVTQIAPGRGGDVSRLAVSALISGALSTFMSASIAGLLVTDQAAYFTPSAASS
ncbi:MAG: hypothetical protein ALECFALPRED_009057 [Alectoria fallacina]|uniref:Solute carrier family 28 member 3 n=1 Tax=Alectoria fallacina TaxID=1903189 RepID=A0A8H3J677_9LECA|nr:MAG: hypothetical protein ALECFALPRED_009057 [Alectoria fallacina]